MHGGGSHWDDCGWPTDSGNPWVDCHQAGGNGDWRAERRVAGKKEKTYASYTYLGSGRHRLPHEDRCALASLVLNRIEWGTGVEIPNIVVAPWGGGGMKR